MRQSESLKGLMCVVISGSEHQVEPSQKKSKCSPGHGGTWETNYSLVSITVHHRLTVHIEFSCVTGADFLYVGQVHRCTGILPEGFPLGLHSPSLEVSSSLGLHCVRWIPCEPLLFISFPPRWHAPHCFPAFSEIPSVPLGDLYPALTAYG